MGWHFITCYTQLVHIECTHRIIIAIHIIAVCMGGFLNELATLFSPLSSSLLLPSFAGMMDRKVAIEKKIFLE